MPNEFEPRIERAFTPPSRVYIDAQALESEKRAVFYKTWQLAGSADQAPGPGCYLTVDICGESILLARDSSGTLRGFHNVCRHRAGPVAQGPGCRSSFQCQYHGWTYALDGRLLTTPEFGGVECFDKEQMGLVPVQVEIWENLIFVKLTPGRDNISLIEYLGDIPDAVRAMRIGAMSMVEKRDYVLECNWKVYVDNYLEGYHIPIVHPSLMRELDYNAYSTITGRYHSLQHAPIRASKPGTGGLRRYSYEQGQTQALFYWVFPNLMLNVYPDNFSTNLIIPLSVDRTLTVFEWYFLDAGSEEATEKIRQTIEFSDEIQQEDIHICEAVQRGLRSISYDRGRYSVTRENGVHHFHSLLHEFMST
jgi:choline monooxygenase